VGTFTLDGLEAAVDELAMAYATTPPAALLPEVRRHLAAVIRLTDARMTLAQRRRLLVAGGWLSLLRSTLHIDLRQVTAAEAHLATAASMADHAGHAEIASWVLETRAWDRLTGKDYRAALDLSVQAQRVAPRGSSPHIQSTAQEGRARARMGDSAGTRRALARTARLVSALALPDQPEHHFDYDPATATAYVATTLSLVGDPAAEEYARAVVAQMQARRTGWPARGGSRRRGWIWAWHWSPRASRMRPPQAFSPAGRSATDVSATGSIALVASLASDRGKVSSTGGVAMSPIAGGAA
jgi:hypothetical protein